MELVVLFCTDGSDLSLDALTAGQGVLGRPDRAVICSVVEPVDPSLVTGVGIAGGVMTPEQFDTMARDRDVEGREALERARSALQLPDAEILVATGAPGPTLCDVAAELSASVIVIGTRGHGGIRRAVLGSVSDHVVRNAPCPVVTVGSQ